MNIIKWIVFSLGGLAFLITVVFSVMLLITPPTPKSDTDLTDTPKETVDYLKNKKGILSKNEALIVKVAQLEKEVATQNTLIDSLKQIALEKEVLSEALDKLNSASQASSDRSARAKDIAKTLAEMKSKTMGPILNKLDDDTVMLIYTQTSKTARKNILLALSEDRAAKITKKIINQN